MSYAKKDQRFNVSSNNNQNKNFKKGFKKGAAEKFKPTFKEKIPTWKIIDAEIKDLLPKYDLIDASKIEKFEDFPLSKRTLDGLAKAQYKKPTEIQRESIGLTLRGYDVLGAAKTGSGKTLAFLVPILECLYHAKWSKHDGLGALIISPTRELAYQTFEVLKKIGKFHDFSAGLVIGGKDLKTESTIISMTNIIVCTPGRLLQHMDETWNFTCDNLKILILDEADRILDLGFADTMNAIVGNLPTTRQTLLFSATQTKSVKDLARLSLQNPTYVSVHEHSDMSTPANLEQSYVICDTHNKLNFLWSFIHNHLNQKILVFFQSCKQVKYVYEAFTKMQTGMITLSLYGTMNQIRRMEVYDQFCRKQNAVLFATDIAARGLDFPSVNWVVQMDCPPDTNTYIHRVGRTARYEKDGKAILVLTPHEEPEMLKDLQAKKIPLSKIEVNSNRISSIDSKLQSLCAGEVELKESAKRALMAYMRSLYLMSNKKIFNLDSVDIARFSSSLGLVVAPRIRFLQKRAAVLAAKQDKLKKKSSESDEEEDTNDEDTEKSSLMPKKTSQTSNSLTGNNNTSTFTFDKGAFQDDNDLFTVRPVFNPNKNALTGKDEDNEVDIKGLEPFTTRNSRKVKSKASMVRKILNKNIKVNTVTKFDEDDNVDNSDINAPKSLTESGKATTKSGIDIEEAIARLKAEDVEDKKRDRERIKRIHREERFKEKAIRRAKRAKTDGAADDDDGETEVVFGNNDDGDDFNEDDNENEDEGDNDDDDHDSENN